MKTGLKKPFDFLLIPSLRPIWQLVSLAAMLSYLAALGLPAAHTPPGVLLAKSSADDCGEYCSPAATVHGDPVRPPSYRPQLSRLLAR